MKLKAKNAYQQKGDTLKKFLSLKVFFVMLVCNDLFLKSALSSVGAPAFACEGTMSLTKDDCSDRFIKLVIMCETTIFILLLTKNYQAAKEFPVESSDYPGAPHSGCSLILKSFIFTDVVSNFIMVNSSAEVRHASPQHREIPLVEKSAP